MQDPFGFGAIAGHVKDFLVKVLDLRSTRTKLENEALWIENQFKLLRLVHALRVDRSGAVEMDDVLAVEEPLEIRVDDKPIAVTMRTPGDDLDLAAGLLFTKAIVREPSAIEFLRQCGPNVVQVAIEGNAQRRFDAFRAQTPPLTTHLRVDYEVVAGLPDQLRDERRPFEVTGGIHAAGIFSADGTLLRVREDFECRNAVDKVIGSFFREGLAVDDKILVVSGRVGSDIVQKAIVARIPMLVAAGAPSTRAVQFAHASGVRLCGCVHDGRFTVY